MPPSAAHPLDVGVILDSPDECWPSMDLVGEMLLAQWNSLPAEVFATPLVLGIPPIARRIPGAARSRHAFNVDRGLVRYLGYPLKVTTAQRRDRMFHVVDHSYAQVIQALPACRTGVYCHDLDAIRAALEAPRDMAPGRESEVPWWKRALAWVLRRALQSAAVVFYSTQGVGRGLEHHGVVRRDRLVHAPYGIAKEFSPTDDSGNHGDFGLDPVADLAGASFVLHVGSGVRRKRLDILFEVFARLRERRRDLRLVQQGATLSADQRAHVARLGIADAIVQPPRLARVDLARLYRGAAVVLMTSEAEGFGLPLAEALACGAKVVASDIEALREVGGEAVVYAPVADIEAWSEIVERVLAVPAASPAREVRLARSLAFSWERHARTILDAYGRIASEMPKAT